MVNKTAINVIIHYDFLHKRVHMTSADLLSFFFFLMSSCHDLIFALILDKWNGAVWILSCDPHFSVLKSFWRLLSEGSPEVKNLLNCFTQPGLIPAGDKACSGSITTCPGVQVLHHPQDQSRAHTLLAHPGPPQVPWTHGEPLALWHSWVLLLTMMP